MLVQAAEGQARFALQPPSVVLCPFTGGGTCYERARRGSDPRKYRPRCLSSFPSDHSILPRTR